ncbi:hypothetical protein N2152v2_006936 [Parachlorella kessleri]
MLAVTATRVTGIARRFSSSDGAQPWPLSRDRSVQQARQQQQQQQLEPAAPASSSSMPRYRTQSRCSLSSINDPENYGLLGFGSSLGSSEGYYWQGPHSMANPEYVSAPGSLRLRALSPLPTKQGFATAKTQTTVQRIVFRSSMTDPVVPLGSGLAADKAADASEQ